MDGVALDEIRVLHVDDNIDFVDVTSAFLERENDRIRVEAATSARDGLERLAEAPIDCIVSDYDMNGRNGIEFLADVRTEYPDLPFILFTGKGSEEVASEAISAGVTDYLRKERGADQYALLANRIVNAVEAAQAELARRRHLRAIETAQEGISIINEAGEFSYVNEAYASLYGYEPREMVGRQFDITYPDGALDVVQGDVLPTLEETGYWHGETTGLRADGSTFVEDHTLVKSDEGELICSVRDKSERKAHKRAIEGLHSTVRALMAAETAVEAAEATVTAVHNVVDLSANIVYCRNGDYLRPVAWTDRAESLLGTVPAIPRDEGVMWDAFETGERHVAADVSTVPDQPYTGSALRSVLVLPLGDYGVLVVGSQDSGAFDDTDVALVQTLAAHATTAIRGIQSKQDLREEREFVNQAIEALNDVFYVIGPDGELRRWNNQLREVTGYADDAIQGMAMTEFFCKEDREQVDDAFAETAATGQATFESEIRTAEGGRVPYEFAVARLVDSDGEVTGAVGIGRNVSTRQEQKRQLERQNDRLNEFAGIISHDLRNPLNIAQGHLDLAWENRDDDHFAAVERAHERMEILIDDILAVAQEGETALEKEAIQLNAFADTCWLNVETYDATFLDETTHKIRADRTQLQQLLENCVRNAVEHGGEDVTVTIGDLPNGFYIEDDGAGISASARQEVFEPGYSTGGGTGLGLSIAANVAESHGWEIAVKKGAAGGARFEITDVETVP